MDTTKKGFIPVMITPFKHNKAVDYDALTRLTHLYLDAGASGLFANCLSSEMFQLTNEERIRITQHIITTTAGRVPVVTTGTFDGRIENKAEFIKRIYNTGAAAVITITSLMAEKGETDEALNENLFKLLDLTGRIPLGFYECPVPYKRVLTAEQLGLFVRTGRIGYHKDTSLDLESIKQKIAAGKGYDFGLYDAFAGHAVASLKAGAAGLSCIQGNYFPELMVWLCNHYDDAALVHDVNEVQKFLIDNMTVMHEAYPATAKYHLKKSGIAINMVSRVNQARLTKENKDKIEVLHQNYEVLKQRLEMC